VVCVVGKKCSKKALRFSVNRCIDCELEPRVADVQLMTIGTRERGISLLAPRLIESYWHRPPLESVNSLSDC